MRSSNSRLLENLKTVRQYKAEAFRGQPRLRICWVPRRVYSSRFFLYDPAAPAMLSFPETVGCMQESLAAKKSCDARSVKELHG
jgi:hypothetical protein